LATLKVPPAKPDPKLFALPLYKYVSVDDGNRLTKELREISRMIHGLIKSLDR
jgi:hypothetical protein